MRITCTLDMLLTATRALKQLSPGSIEKIQQFIKEQQAPDGGFCDRAGKSDLYYTLFAVAVSALSGAEVNHAKLNQYLTSFADGENLDFVHLASLGRCLASKPYLNSISTLLKMADSPLRLIPQLAAKLFRGNPPESAHQLLQKMEAYRTTDGGYNQNRKGAQQSTAYAGFLALLTYQDLGQPIPDIHLLKSSTDRNRLADGSFTNDPEIGSGATTATAAGIVLSRELELKPDSSSLDALLARSAPSGGFLAVSNSPVPDLLSTATALYALKRSGHPLGNLAARNVSFVESLWNEDGGFSGHALDAQSDCEYTFYALLALGCLGL